MFRNTIIFFSVFLVCLMPGRAFSWFSQSDGTKTSGFTMSSSRPDISSNIYVLHYNTPEEYENSGIFLDSGGNSGLFADRINIDIPLGILSKEEIDPEEYLDRLLVANLRIQNILNEYLVFRKRTEFMLKDLRNPYLEKFKNKGKQKFAVAGEFQEGVRLKKNFENIVYYGPGNNKMVFEKVEPSADVINQTARVGTWGIANQQPGNNSGLNKLADTAGYQNLPSKDFARSSDNEQSGIFSLVPKIFNYILKNKLEILLWLAIVSLSGLLITLVVKR